MKPAPSVADVRAWQPTFGANPEGEGTTFRVWAPAAEEMRLVIGGGDVARETLLVRRPGGWFEARVQGAMAGTRYGLRMDDGPRFPDPASRFQPEGVHGPSEVIDWKQFTWSDGGWNGVPLERLIIYELHVGTFTPGATFDGVVDRLPYLADLGVTAIELMPVAAFAGRRNWGYDGVALFSPASQYGRPEDLRRLVDCAHRSGLAVLLDVVYNHLGPDGAYLAAFSPQFFSSTHDSPWGRSVNLDGPDSDAVRRFLVENALHWFHEYHVDGLRLDATHALADDSRVHLLAELAAAVHALGGGRPLHVLAEDDRNMATLVRGRDAGGLGLDAVWADDFHHEMHCVLTGEREGYYADYAGRVEQVATAIDRGWTYAGQHSTHAGGARGTDSSGVPLCRFVFCLQNHDQVGNRARGERLAQLADPAAVRAAAALLALAPETPLLFMGEEWAASTPFLYFTDHHDELGRAVTEGRRAEFASFAGFSDPAARRRIPDPQAEETFAASRLDWSEVSQTPHAGVRRLYRGLFRLRQACVDLAHVSPAPVTRVLDGAAVALLRRHRDGDVLVVARLEGSGRVELPRTWPDRWWDEDAGSTWTVTLTTEDHAFADDGMVPRIERDAESTFLHFPRAAAVVLRRRRKDT